MVSCHLETRWRTRLCFVCYGSNLRDDASSDPQSRTRRRFPATVLVNDFFIFVMKIADKPIPTVRIHLVGKVVGTAAVTLLSNGEL